MDVDFAVELGQDDETLDFPWAAPEGGPRYFDLKREPELLACISEAEGVHELGGFLLAVNSPESMLETAKCDVWSTSELNPQDEIFGLAIKFGSYVDLLFSQEEFRQSFSKHEHLAKELTQWLRREPEISAAAEFLIRRCFYHGESDIREGFYFTFYLFGFGDDVSQARQQWAVGLNRVQNAILQISSAPGDL